MVAASRFFAPIYGINSMLTGATSRLIDPPAVYIFIAIEIVYERLPESFTKRGSNGSREWRSQEAGGK
jgi:hypothetical protein